MLHFVERHSLTSTLRLPTLDSPQSSSEATGVVLTHCHVQCNIPRMGCSCTGCNWSTSTYSVGGASTSRTACQDGCKGNTEKKRIISLIKRRTFYTWILDFSLQASLTITRGAGCFSITPYIDFRVVVPVYTPAFKLLMDTEKGLRSQTAGYGERSA